MKVLLNIDLSNNQLNKFKTTFPQVIFSSNLNDYDADILVGNFKPESIKEYKNAKLFLSTAVGYDNYIKRGILNNNIILCNAVGVHSKEVAEHLFSMMVMMIKNLHIYRDNQFNHNWNDEGIVKSLSDLKVTIIGLGSIGMELAGLCKNLGMRVIGVKRKMIDKPKCVDLLLTNNNIDEAIKDADVVFSVIPGSKENVHLFDINKFKLMKNDAILINGGRGNLIDRDVLYEVCSKKIIKGIGQDVFDKEPLTKEDELWSLKNLFITPHVAGFFHLEKAKDEFVDLCIENINRFINNKELLNIVTERE